MSASRFHRGTGIALRVYRTYERASRELIIHTVCHYLAIETSQYNSRGQVRALLDKKDISLSWLV